MTIDILLYRHNTYHENLTIQKYPSTLILDQLVIKIYVKGE